MVARFAGASAIVLGVRMLFRYSFEKTPESV
jgi:hypothetical protein